MTPAVTALVLAALGTGVLAGCSADGDPAPGPSATPSPAADSAVVRRALDRERALLAAYDPAASFADPTLASLGAAARAHHDLHLAALLEIASRLGISTSETPSAAASAGLPTPPAAVDDVAAARRILALEAGSGEIAVREVHASADARVARLVAQIGASEAQHATALYLALREGQIRRREAPLATPAPAAT
ncbi:MAG TPA: hypothetical protein VNA12_10840 [Mycobacteriales bacterium]|nr:hypothetical protein [Mycobacteriales bacterium]